MLRYALSAASASHSSGRELSRRAVAPATAATSNAREAGAGRRNAAEISRKPASVRAENTAGS